MRFSFRNKYLWSFYNKLIIWNIPMQLGMYNVRDFGWKRESLLDVIRTLIFESLGVISLNNGGSSSSSLEDVGIKPNHLKQLIKVFG